MRDFLKCDDGALICRPCAEPVEREDPGDVVKVGTCVNCGYAVKVCPYCKSVTCRSSARTANGRDLERFERIHHRERGTQ